MMNKAAYVRAMAGARGDADDMLSASIQRIQYLEALADVAETLLCNAQPMPHLTQGGWDLAVSQWRDNKHGVTG